MIAVGDKLPSTVFRIKGAEGIESKTTEELFGGRKAVLFGVPGAFTPTCDGNHLPGYLRLLDALQAKGVEIVAVTGVNDAFVMNAWAESTGGKGKILFLADGNGDFARAIGLTLDASGAGLGIRSKRYAMVVDDLVVDYLAVEDVPSKAEASSADATLAALG